LSGRAMASGDFGVGGLSARGDARWRSAVSGR
jgi:hypothetical protein